MNKHDKSNHKDVLTLLESLQETPSQEVETAKRQRAKFLDQVNSLPQPVSPSQFLRLNMRNNIGNLRFRTLTAAIVILIAVLGSSAVTVAAAQQSLPGEQLYPVKIWFEDVRLTFSINQLSKLDLHLEFAAERLEELSALSNQGHAQIPPELKSNFNQHLIDASALLHEDDFLGFSDEVEALLSQFEDFEDQEEEESEADEALEEIESLEEDERDDDDRSENDKDKQDEGENYQDDSEDAPDGEDDSDPARSDDSDGRSENDDDLDRSEEPDNDD